tara:strand:- start:65766 stop:67337 length:1572 start_codon:yes stop_codon:yes gene_type:complete
MLLVSLLPPLIVLILGFVTRRIATSLFVGLFVAAFIAKDYALGETFWHVGGLLSGNLNLPKWIETGSFWSCDNLLIFTFILLLGVVIEMVKESRGIQACIQLTRSFLKDKRDTETASLIFSHILMVDDYLSTLTVGSVMRSLTDKMKIPRAKLAYLVDSLGCPLALMCPVSSWAAAVVGFLTESGVSATAADSTVLLAEPGSVYFGILPFLFYSMTLIVSVWFVVRSGLSFGSMKRREARARAGDLGIDKKYADHTAFTDEIPKKMTRSALLDFFLPVCVLSVVSLSCIISGMKFQGALFTAGVSCLVVSAAYYLAIGEFPIKRLWGLAKEGVALMMPAVLILLLAWTLGDVLRDDLKTGQLLADAAAGALPIRFLPVVLFVTCSLMGFGLGTAWGVSAVMIPIAIPMTIAITGQSLPITPEQVPVIYIVFGAILSGAVCGDHLSLISDTSIMTVTSTQCNLVDHIKTQLGYALPVVVATAIGFLVAGFLAKNHGLAFIATVSVLVSSVTSIGLLWMLGRSKE